MTDHPKSDGLAARFGFRLHEMNLMAHLKELKVTCRKQQRHVINGKAAALFFPPKTITVQLESITFDISQLLSKDSLTPPVLTDLTKVLLHVTLRDQTGLSETGSACFG